MKKAIFLVFISCFFAQSQESSLTVDRGSIVWQKVFEGNAENVNHPTLNEGYSTANTLPKCKGISIFMYYPMDFQYSIETKADSFRVTVKNITFENDPIEFYCLKTDGTIRQNKQMQRNDTCLNDFFTEIFTPNPEAETKW